MKHPLESLMTAAGIFADGVALQPAAARPFARPVLAQKLVGDLFIWRIQPAFILCCFVYGFCCSALNIMLFALSGGAGFRWPIKHFNAYAMLLR